MVNSPLIRPYLLGGSFGGGTLGSHDIDQMNVVSYTSLGILAHLLRIFRMVMEPKHFAEEVIVHPNHPLTI